MESSSEDLQCFALSGVALRVREGSKLRVEDPAWDGFALPSHEMGPPFELNPGFGLLKVRSAVIRLKGSHEFLNSDWHVITEAAVLSRGTVNTFVVSVILATCIVADILARVRA